MDDSALLKLSLAVSIIGIAGLFLFSNGKTSYSIGDLDGLTGQAVTVNGTVQSFYTSKAGTTFIQLADDTGSIQAVIFKNTNIDANLQNGLTIEIGGTVAEYEGKLEIVADSVKTVS